MKKLLRMKALNFSYFRLMYNWFIFVFLLLTSSVNSLRDFKLGLLTPWSLEYEFSGITSASAASIAIERVNREPELNGNGTFTLSLVHRDSKCRSKIALGNAVDLWYNESVSAFLGPPCSVACRAVAEVASNFNIPLISWVASDTDLVDKTTYTTLARTLGPFSKMGLFLVQHLKLFNWKRVVMLGSNYLMYRDATRAITKVFVENNITIAYQSNYDRFPSHVYIEKTLIKLKLLGRVVFLSCPKEDRRLFMIKANQLGMTQGDYVFYTIDMLPEDKILDDEPVWKGNDEFDQVAKQAFECVFHVSLASVGAGQTIDFRLTVADRMRQLPWNETIPKDMQRDNNAIMGDKYSIFLYDAVILYAMALKTTIEEGSDPDVGVHVFNNMRNISFMGMSGSVVMDDLADREPDYWILDMEPATGTFIIIAELVNDNQEGKKLHNTLEPMWPGGKRGQKYAPPDVPTCGFRNDLCGPTGVPKWVVILCIGAVCLLVAAAVIIALFLYKKIKYETDMLIQSWRIDFSEVEMANRRGYSRSTPKLAGNVTGSKVTTANSMASSSQSTSSNNRSIQSMAQMKSIASFGTTMQQVFSDIGYYRGVRCAIKHIQKDHIQLTRRVLAEFNEVKDIAQENLNVFVGASIDAPNICLIWHYCPKGSLEDILMNDDLALDDHFKLSFLSDISKGMEYIQRSHLGSHGNLKTSNCLVDSRWTVRITDYGLTSFLSGQEKSDETENDKYKVKLWTAPELLRENFPPERGTQKGDVYSFGIISYVIMMRTEPYSFEDMTPRDVVNRVRNGESIPYRPQVDKEVEALLDQHVVNLMRKCWSEDPQKRPTFTSIKTTIRKKTKGKLNIMDNILEMMDKYAYNLESIVEERTGQLVEETAKTEQLLYKILPRSVADQLKVGKPVIPESYDQGTIYFSDIVGFTTISADSSPMQIVDFLNDLYSCFDEIISKHDVYKVETIGDAYMVVSGVPVRNGKKHAMEIANVSLDLLSVVMSFKIRHRPREQLQLRIGLHTGPVVSGVVGLTMPRYCLFGETVSVAAKMESTGKPLRIQISMVTCNFLQDFGGYKMASRRNEINIKGKGFQKTCWLYGREGFDKPLPVFESEGPSYGKLRVTSTVLGWLTSSRHELMLRKMRSRRSSVRSRRPSVGSRRSSVGSRRSSVGSQ